MVHQPPSRILCLTFRSFYRTQGSLGGPSPAAHGANAGLSGSEGKTRHVFLWHSHSSAKYHHTHTHTDPWRKNLQQTGRNTVTVALGTSVASWNTQTSIAAAMDNYDDYAHVGLYQPCLKQQMEITDAGWPSQIPAS